MRNPYGVNKEYFRYSLFLVFCNRITTSAVSACFLLVRLIEIFNHNSQIMGMAVAVWTVARASFVHSLRTCLQASKKALDPVAPVYKYCLVSVSNILTTTCQYEVSGLHFQCSYVRNIYLQIAGWVLLCLHSVMRHFCSRLSNMSASLFRH